MSQTPCQNCFGTGWVGGVHQVNLGYSLFDALYHSKICSTCNGSGWLWVYPDSDCETVELHPDVNSGLTEIKREFPETMPCDCKWFAANIAKINACIQFCGTHGWKYTAEYIQFCPWCGIRLKEKP